ncbi:rhomboid family intramembrane serine protease [Tianweitania sp. BSSL-BM11]|uniref:Rhomboid family intramembrane serine protease n=1 Tax=Tianweitania aestuarii TaxID=2814886 RepID=A0ABS5RUE0_9HYPH|nr:rhomboid family intramembrane serine protease [Tianweitania aestuarii]MBS9720619.1 rhomboid family intramembrane serine protease [Tianweitania aestuarii]
MSIPEENQRTDAVVEPGPAASAPREPLFNIPSAVLLMIALCVGVHLVRLYLLTEEQDIDLMVRAAFIPVRYSGEYLFDIYAVTSTVTYAFLHGGWSHLIVNMVWLAAFGSPLANRMGPWRFFAFWLVTAWGAVALHYALHTGSEIPLVGASGAISGMMGAAARFGFQIDRRWGQGRFSGPPLTIAESLTSRTVIVFLVVWMAVNLISGMGYLTPEDMGAVAWEAHVGGFLVGFLFVGFFGEVRPRAVRMA